MGLDVVELIMDVEDSFGVEIPSDAAQELVTVGDMFEFIKSKTALAPTGTCLTAATFYDLRNGLRIAGVDERYGPSTHLQEILPSKNRRLFWAKLARTTQFRLPNLVRPLWAVLLGIGATLLLSLVIASIVFEQGFSGYAITFTFIACIALFGIISYSVTSPLATNFANEFCTFRGLSERVLVLNAARQSNEHGPMGPNDIWVVLREIIANQLGVDADEVTLEASFVKDLGCD